MNQAATGRELKIEPARRFFLERIEREAAQEGRPLSDAEREFLRRMAYAEGKDYEALEKAVGGEDAVNALSERAAGLLERCLKNEGAADRSIIEAYKRNLKQIEQEDLLLMFIAAWSVEPKATRTLAYTLHIAFTAAGIIIVITVLMLIIGLLRHH